jgi:hypothetical protein
VRGAGWRQLAIQSPGAREQRLPVPGGGSLFRPALWKSTVAFLRAGPNGGGGHPVEMFEWTSGSKHLKALALPRNSYTAAEIKQQARSTLATKKASANTKALWTRQCRSARACLDATELPRPLRRRRTRAVAGERQMEGNQTAKLSVGLSRTEFDEAGA